MHAHLRDDLIAISAETIAAVDPARLLQQRCRLEAGALHIAEGRSRARRYDLSLYEQIFLVAIGKAAEPMARYFIGELGSALDDALIITKERTAPAIGAIPIYTGGHPLPTEESVCNGKRLMELLARAKEKTLVINCISGGASALCIVPHSDDNGAITLEEYRRVTHLLLTKGVPIEECNCIRIHLSDIKGGKYLLRLFPARSLSLILSDVRYDDTRAIGSGLTDSRHCSAADAMRICDDYSLWDEMPPKIAALIRRRNERAAGNTPEHADKNALARADTNTIASTEERARQNAAAVQPESAKYSERAAENTPARADTNTIASTEERARQNAAAVQPESAKYSERAAENTPARADTNAIASTPQNATAAQPESAKYSERAAENTPARAAESHSPERAAERAAENTPARAAESHSPERATERAYAENDNIIIGTTYHALDAARTSAAQRGYTPLLITDVLCGEARQAAHFIAMVVAFHLRHAEESVGTRLCLLFGGETTVTVTGSGKGGRNQELAVAFLKTVAEDPFLRHMRDHFALISFATDGNDGPTDAAGGIADSEAAALIAREGHDIDGALANNDSYTFLQRAKSLYISGYSATNVCDVQCVLIAR